MPRIDRRLTDEHVGVETELIDLTLAVCAVDEIDTRVARRHLELEERRGPTRTEDALQLSGTRA
jgi:hypothetical protein